MRILKVTPLAAAALTLSTPSFAATVFVDNFDGDTPGLNKTNFTNFASTGAGLVDLVASGSHSITCSGNCVDLDGTPGPGEITSLASFGFNSGDMVRLSFDIGGSQRGSVEDQWYAGIAFGGATQLFNLGTSFAGTDNIVVADILANSVEHYGFVPGTDPFATRSIFFTAGDAGTLTFNFGSESADNIGPLLDNVRLDVTSAVPEPATWALMILGFGAIGGTMRGSRRRGSALTA